MWEAFVPNFANLIGRVARKDSEVDKTLVTMLPQELSGGTSLDAGSRRSCHAIPPRSHFLALQIPSHYFLVIDESFPKVRRKPGVCVAPTMATTPRRRPLRAPPVGSPYRQSRGEASAFFSGENKAPLIGVFVCVRLGRSSSQSTKSSLFS